MSGTWSYDGSLDGLILLAGQALSLGAAPEAVANALAPEGELFALPGPSPLSAPRDERESAEAERELRAFSEELFDLVLGVWMSEEPLELALLGLCAEAGERGSRVLTDRRDPRVRALSAAAYRVDREIHRLIGLARFSRRRDGLFSAPIEPDHNVAAALMPSFLARFGAQDFAIVDLKRRLAFASRDGRATAVSGDEALDLLPDGSDAEDQGLWRRYFRAAENPSRRNPALQRRLMPARYWKHLPELGT